MPLLAPAVNEMSETLHTRSSSIVAHLQLPFDCAWAPLKITTAVGDVQAPAGMPGRL